MLIFLLACEDGSDVAVFMRGRTVQDKRYPALTSLKTRAVACKSLKDFTVEV